MTYFTPDRSNRPTDAGDPSGGTTEIGADRTKTLDLADGRTAVVEAANVDGFTLVYYYFVARGMEDVTDEELVVQRHFPRGTSSAHESDACVAVSRRCSTASPASRRLGLGSMASPKALTSKVTLYY